MLRLRTPFQGGARLPGMLEKLQSPSLLEKPAPTIPPSSTTSLLTVSLKIRKLVYKRYYIG